MGNSSAKAELIPHVVLLRMEQQPKPGIRKDLALGEELAAYQLVGGVKAHQG